MFNNNGFGGGCGGGCGSDIFLILILLCCCGNKGGNGGCCERDCHERRCCDNGNSGCDWIIWLILIFCMCGK